MASVIRREIRRKISEVGHASTIKIVVCKLISMIQKRISIKKDILPPFDLKYRTDTSGIIRPGALDIPDNRVTHAFRYQTPIVEVFLDLLSTLSISYDDFFFVDLGSGKGRALLLASQFPFKEIIGVELSETLHRTVCRNIQIYKDEQQRCHKIQSVCEDAANYDIPHEKVVFYLFNPFDEHVMCAVLLNIEDSICKYPRDIYIVYLKPVCRDLFDQAPFFQILKETERYVIYSNKPQDSA